MSSALGDHLRARRAAVDPSQVGLPADGRRRVPGLRREEVAVLAGVSIDYYTRLEQGRETAPSPQILEALSSAFILDEDARLHLYRLAGHAPRLSGGGLEQVDPDLQTLMDQWSRTPAIVLGHAYDVLGGNLLGEALFSGFPVTRNLLEMVFLDPASRTFYADWETAAENTVAGYRLQQGHAPDDARMRAVLTGLLERSPEFAGMWQRNRAAGKRLELKTFVHAEVGPITLRTMAFDVRSAPGQQLVTYLAAPGSSSADAVELLGTLAATSSLND